MKLIASFGYLGFCPVAPGTAGTAGAAAIFLALAAAGLRGAALNGVLLAFLAASSLLCVPAGGWAERAYKKKDPGVVVIDEVAGYFVTVLFIPFEGFQDGLVVCVAAFFLFRFFDIVKPPPVRWFERFKGGLGILLDDLMAGVYANGALWILWALFLR